jgi:DNA-binding transcriptional LysR family regulator
LIWEALETKRLVVALEDWSAPPLALNLVTPGGGPRPPRISALIDFLSRRFTAGSTAWTRVLG